MTFTHVSSRLGATIVAAALGGALQASAAEVPNMVGSWKPVADIHASIRLGAANDHHTEYQTPSTGTPADAWTIVIEGQEGRAFHGYALSPKGKREPVVGVINHNAEHLFISAEEAAIHGEFFDGQIELCYVDHEPDRAGVACNVLAKQGS